MAQSIQHTWLCEGETLSATCHHYNRYGAQLGVKVPLWGGFTGGGIFAFREWTPAPKMTKRDWAAVQPRVKRAVDGAAEVRRSVRAKVWQDNERLLLQPSEYRRSGLQMECFPPNSGDLNPIETVWAWLRRDLARREQDDFASGRVLSVKQFRQRVSQVLQSYEEVRPGQW